MTHLLSSLSCLLPMLLAVTLPAQQCFDFGSRPIPQQVEASPFLLGCALAPQWPTWHLLTPAHAAPAPHDGYAPGDARPRARLLIHYRCTGWLLLPVLPDSVRRSGYVIHQPEYPCT